MGCARHDRDERVGYAFVLELLETDGIVGRRPSREEREEQRTERVDVGGHAVLIPRQALGSEMYRAPSVGLMLEVTQVEGVRRDQDAALFGDEDVLGAKLAQHHRVLAMCV